MSLGMVVIAMLLASAAQATKYVDRIVGQTASGTQGGQFFNPRGVALNDATADGNGADGWLYVADGSNHRIQAFNAAGEFQWAIGRDVIRVAPTTDIDLGDVFEKCTTASDCKAGSSGTTSDGPAGEFDSPMGIAINQVTGDFYVRDPRNRRVQQFTADGDFIRTWGFDVIIATGPPPNSNGTGFEICDVTNGNVLADCKIGTNGTGIGQFGTSTVGQTGIAVQQSTGDVFVADPGGTGNRRILRFEGDGSAPAVIGSSAVFTSTGYPRDVAVDDDFVYAGRLNATTGGIARYDIDAAAFVDPISLSQSSLTIDPGTGNLFAAENDAELGWVVSEFATPGGAATEIDSHLPGSGFDYTNSSGIAVGPGGDELYVSASPDRGHFVAVADDDGAPQAAANVLPPTAVGSDSAALHGEITTSDPLATNYRLEYSTNGTDWVVAGTGQVGGDAAGVEVEATATGLEPNTLYRTRLVTSRAFGNPEFESAELTFLTDAVPPEIADARAVSITDTAARLQARINAHSTSTTYRFEYGIGNFNRSVPVPDGPVGSGPEFVFVAQQVTGLQPNAEYQFRVVATSVTEGTTTSAARSFRTAIGAPRAAQRAYELVSPADKVGGAGVGRWGGGMVGAAVVSGLPAYRGDRFAAAGNLGSVLLDGAIAYAQDWAFADRTDGGWVSHSPLTHIPSNQQSTRFANVASVGEALNTVVWVSNGNLLRVFPELAPWPGVAAHFVGDWAGRWELLAPTDVGQIHHLEGQSFLHSMASKDGSAVLTVPSSRGTPARAAVGGMAGSDDPAHPDWTDLQFGRAVYLDDVSAGLSDEFAGNGEFSNVGVCTGTAGSDRTAIPAVAAGDLVATVCPDGIDGRDRLISSRGATVAPTEASDTGGSVENAVSRDGSRVFFLSPDPLAASVPAANCPTVSGATVCPPQLYVRQRNEDGSVTTRWISRAEDGLFGTQDATLAGEVRFAGASTDGDKVFFQTDSPLTADDPNGACGAPCTTGTPSSQSSDLYMYDLPDGPDGDPLDADPAGGALTRISRGPDGAGDCDVVSNSAHAALRFVSDDGARAYFTCSAPLAGAAPAPEGGVTQPAGTAATTDATNLYAYDASSSDPEWSFVARLPKTTDVPAACATTNSTRDGLLIDTEASSLIGFNGMSHCVRGTADGAFATFWTTAALTADDPDSTTLDGYAYDHEANAITRITAPQGGVGGTYLCNPTTGQAPVQCHGDNGFGKRSQPDLGVATEPAVEGDRIAFFQTRSRLVPEDTDDAYDVYEWRNGALELISTGHSAGGGDVDGTGGAFYKGNDVTGTNVYLATNDRLTWQDHDGVLDIYAARVGGGFAQPAAPQVCAVIAGGCHQRGDAAPVGARSETSSGGGGDASPGVRAQLSLGRIGRRAARRAARTGVLAVRVRASAAGRVTVLARGRVRVGRAKARVRRVARTRTRVREAGAVTVRLRLNKAAQRQLRAGGRLRLAVQARTPGARARSATVLLRRAGR